MTLFFKQEEVKNLQPSLIRQSVILRLSMNPVLFYYDYEPEMTIKNRVTLFRLLLLHKNNTAPGSAYGPGFQHILRSLLGIPCQKFPKGSSIMIRERDLSLVTVCRLCVHHVFIHHNRT